MNAEQIKEYALSIGFCKAGIGSAEGYLDYVREVESRGDTFDFFAYTTTNPLKDAVPTVKFPEARSVIVLAWDYYQQEFPEKLKHLVGKAYLGRGYNPIEGTMPRARLELMIKYLEKGGCKVRSDIGLPVRWAGAATGVSQFGRNNFAYCGEAGSYIILYCLVVDQEFDYDEPARDVPCPPNCRACIDACPTGALYAPFHIEPRKCLAFNHWMTREGVEGLSAHIPYEIRKAMGCRIHGCDICQDVCPRNQKTLKKAKPVDAFVELLSEDIDLVTILEMDEAFYERRIRPIMYNYIKDIRYFKRNAMIAMGNSGDKKYIPYLEKYREVPDTMLREYAQWALAALKAALADEKKAERTKNEVEAALQRLV